MKKLNSFLELSGTEDDFFHFFQCYSNSCFILHAKAWVMPRSSLMHGKFSPLSKPHGDLRIFLFLCLMLSNLSNGKLLE